MKTSDISLLLRRPFLLDSRYAWEINSHRIGFGKRAKSILTNVRVQKDSIVVQAVALAELDGLNDPNANGYKPFY